MRSARDSAPDPNCASGSARLPLPTRVRLLSTSGIAPAKPPRPSDAHSGSDTMVSPLVPVPAYRHVLGRQIGDLGDVVRARRPKRLPVALSRSEVKAVLWLGGEVYRFVPTAQWE
jgi:hypothetical protein